MLFRSLIIAIIEDILNIFLHRYLLVLKTVRRRLNGKVLRITLKGFATSIILVFSDLQVDILEEWGGEVNCSIITNLNLLLKLGNSQQFILLINKDALEIEDGDIQVLQDFINLIDLIEFDPAELIAPYIGDIIAERVSKLILVSGVFLHKRTQLLKHYVSEVLTEEWCISPGILEVSGFIEDTATIKHTSEILMKRLKKLEDG